ncbi:hypothetical protein Danklef1_70 [Polaribacter phage Danklef_1]|uniref:Uncharacterized protein n=1 Tax=Polaribacter phage Danklef_1 TaxID=2745646 RepID=A0A8E4ZEV3_9CAUD|nr:hypothetical protein M1M23_gp70 [Polaribacter phage Danklef_1]QQV90631.1 hypothetical protein Danklef2_70 [Polaribacter phage Danklef_2]QQV90708.1 hypothetical protein Danklef3_71 [Polaribacter phage Danklef_3]QQV90785.1 hypothetical protein Danklef4_71 [Polaribacter phage Danklef_4]QQV90863.1 hypothetical protein Danklef5_72 [Polaribacter phage Danklef_5]QQV90555.1 hypothetical protein Danklef1_70 [Polaribacter phage Danklef_1]
MKARAGLLMLLMCIISFTGFSTTTDLDQNSDAVTISNYDVGGTNVIAVVVMDLDFKVKELDNQLFSHYLLMKSNYVFYKSLRSIPFNLTEIPKLSSKNYVINYRRSRDGIICKLS